MEIQLAIQNIVNYKLAARPGFARVVIGRQNPKIRILQRRWTGVMRKHASQSDHVWRATAQRLMLEYFTYANLNAKTSFALFRCGLFLHFLIYSVVQRIFVRWRCSVYFLFAFKWKSPHHSSRRPQVDILMSRLSMLRCRACQCQEWVFPVSRNWVP